MSRPIRDTSGNIVPGFTLLEYYKDYCSATERNPLPDWDVMTLIAKYAELNIPAEDIYSLLCKGHSFTDSCYTCPFFEGFSKFGVSKCCYYQSCEGNQELIAVVPHDRIKTFLYKLQKAPRFKRVKEVSVIVNGRQYIKVYRK